MAKVWLLCVWVIGSASSDEQPPLVVDCRTRASPAVVSTDGRQRDFLLHWHVMITVLITPTLIIISSSISSSSNLISLTYLQ